MPEFENHWSGTRQGGASGSRVLWNLGVPKERNEFLRLSFSISKSRRKKVCVPGERLIRLMEQSLFLVAA